MFKKGDLLKAKDTDHNWWITFDHPGKPGEMKHEDSVNAVPGELAIVVGFDDKGLHLLHVAHRRTSSNWCNPSAYWEKVDVQEG